MSSVIKVAESSSSLESHIFRCLVDDFKSLLLSEKEYRYEYDCGKKLSVSETVKLYFEITVTTGRHGNLLGKQMLEIRGGVMKLARHSIMLSVTPKLLNNDGSVYFEAAPLSINIRNSSTLKWDALQVHLIQSAKTVTRDNKCLIEFHVQLSIPSTSKSSTPTNSSKSITVTTPVVRKQPSAEPAAAAAATASNGKRSSESGASSAKKIKLDQLANQMQDKLKSDMENLMNGDDKDKDVSLEVGQEVVKAHSVVMSARSSVLSALLSDPSSKTEAGLTLKITDLSPSVVKILMHYLYTGSLPENWMEHTDQLLVASTRYELKDLTDYLDLKAPELFTVENAAVYLKMIKGLGLKNMETEMTRFFGRNKDAIIKTTGFEELRGKNPSVLLDWLLN